LNVCRSFYIELYCPLKGNCRYSHDLKKEPCIWNSIGKCKFSATSCRYSHEIKARSPMICFFHLMRGCFNPNCENTHIEENIYKYISY
jgi:hypothetical protein